MHVEKRESGRDGEGAARHAAAAGNERFLGMDGSFPLPGLCAHSASEWPDQAGHVQLDLPSSGPITWVQ